MSQRIKYDWCIGIDPGTNTGVALWSVKAQKFTFVHTYSIYEALKFVENFIKTHQDSRILVRFEDARKRRKVPADAVRLQGAGSVKRDSAIWEEVLSGLEKSFAFAWCGVQPNRKTNKMAKDKILASKTLGITYNTSEHARCAAFLVFGM